MPKDTIPNTCKIESLRRFQEHSHFRRHWPTFPNPSPPRLSHIFFSFLKFRGADYNTMIKTHSLLGTSIGPQGLSGRHVLAAPRLASISRRRAAPIRAESGGLGGFFNKNESKQVHLRLQARFVIPSLQSLDFSVMCFAVPVPAGCSQEGPARCLPGKEGPLCC